MTKTACDRCKKDMPTTGESVTFTLAESPTPWKVSVLVARQRDLCAECRREIVAKGKPA